MHTHEVTTATEASMHGYRMFIATDRTRVDFESCQLNYHYKVLAILYVYRITEAIIICYDAISKDLWWNVLQLAIVS